MVFSSLLFVFFFLPLTVALYYLVGERQKNMVLLSMSLLFYAWGEPIYMVLMCFSIGYNYYTGILLDRYRHNQRGRMLLLFLNIVFNLGCLGYFKYSAMIQDFIASCTGLALEVRIPALPIGISFYSFQALAYAVDVYKGKIVPQKDLLLFALYISFFAQLVAGPIVNYADVADQLTKRDMSFKKFSSGMKRFIYGLAKKMILANHTGEIWANIKAMPGSEVSALLAWSGLIAFALQIYFDFSGYSDMAIGLGKMFGFRFNENFRYPYEAQSIADFWRRWHISLGSWFRDYVYIPLGGNRVVPKKLIRNTLVTWMLTGLWHGASYNFVLWGLYFGILLLIEKLLLKQRILRWSPAIRRIYALFFICLGWVFFEFTNPHEMVHFLKLLFGFSENPFFNIFTMSFLKTNAPLYTIAIVAASSRSKRAMLLLKRAHRHIYTVAAAVFYSALLFVSTAVMVGSTYNPFIYFRF